MYTTEHSQALCFVPGRHILIALITVQLSIMIRAGGLAASLSRISALEACAIPTLPNGNMVVMAATLEATLGQRPVERQLSTPFVTRRDILSSLPLLGVASKDEKQMIIHPITLGALWV